MHTIFHVLYILPIFTDYELLTVMLTSRSIATHKKMLGIANSMLTKEDVEAVKNTFFQFDGVMTVLRALPTSMIIVLRNINIVRSVSRELGAPVNRFNIMARRWVVAMILIVGFLN